MHAHGLKCIMHAQLTAPFGRTVCRLRNQEINATIFIHMHSCAIEQLLRLAVYMTDGDRRHREMRS